MNRLHARQPAVRRLRWTTVLVAGLLAMMLNGVAADQTDARLDDLFGALANAPNALLAREVEQSIWDIWFESRDPRAANMLQAARARAEKGDMAAAMAGFDTLVDDFPQYAEGWNQRAIMRYLTGDVAGSLADIEQALALEPRHFGALSGRGQCYMQLERYHEALVAFEDALSINPWIGSVRAQIKMLQGYIGTPQEPI